MVKQFDVCILGATGVVGGKILEVLAEENFPIKNLYPLASTRSAGKKVNFKGQSLSTIDAEQFDWKKAQLGLFSAGASVSRVYAAKATDAGCVVIDNTSEFRYDDEIPLVVPEVNPTQISNYKNRGIVANPNCSTIQMLVALKPIHDLACIKHINVATYQSVSGSGAQAIDELLTQSQAVLAGNTANCAVYPKQIAFNVIPQIDKFQENGYTKEEMKMVWETQKILDNKIKVNATTVRVPVVVGHSLAITIETQKPVSVEDVAQVLSASPGVKLVNGNTDGMYPTALDSAESNTVFVGRIRKDISRENSLNLWVVADNIRKGAATNTVQIAKHLIQDYL